MGSPFGSALRCHLPQWGRRGALRAHISSAPSGHLPRKGKVLGVRGGIGLDSGGVRGYNGAKMTPAQAGRPKEVTTMMHIGLLGFGVVGGGVWALCIVAFGGRVGGREYVPVELTYGEKTVSIVALRDSGNTLRDPVSGEQVLVVSGEVAERLTGLTQEQLRAPLKTLMCRPVPGLRLIPYRAVGQAGDMLLAMRFDGVKIGSRMQSAVVAFAAEGLGRGDVYQALTGGVI